MKLNSLHEFKLVMRACIFILLQILPMLATCRAEVNNCNGIWTNKPCDQVPEKAKTDHPVQIDPSLSVPPLKEESTVAPPAKEKCKEGENFISDRPLPLIKSEERTLKDRDINRDVEIYGSVYGHGKIAIEITTRGDYGSVERTETKGSKTLLLSEKGEEKVFSIKTTISSGWEWTADVKNIGPFDGYCTTQAEETSKAAIKQKFLETKKTEVRQNNTVINNTLIIDRRYQ